MWSLVLCAALLGEAPSPADQAAGVLPGIWEYSANETAAGTFTIRSVKDGRIAGRMHGQPIAGTFNSRTMEVVLERQRLSKTGERSVIQTYKGILSRVPESEPPRYAIEGTFQSHSDRGAEKRGVEHSWRAAKTDGPNRPGELSQLQGAWVVIESQSSDLIRTVPEETGLVQKNSKVVVRGNELVWNGSVVATLANDLYAPDQVQDAGPSLRGPLVVTLPDGTALWCSYKIKDDVLELVYP